MAHLWVIDFVGGGVPSAATSPEIPEDMFVVADTHFVVVEGSHSQVENIIRDYPYWRNSGHPADGRWISAGGEEVYIANGRILNHERDLWNAMGLKPSTFGGKTWDDVDYDVVRDHVPSF